MECSGHTWRRGFTFGINFTPKRGGETRGRIRGWPSLARQILGEARREGWAGWGWVRRGFSPFDPRSAERNTKHGRLRAEAASETDRVTRAE